MDYAEGRLSIIHPHHTLGTTRARDAWPYRQNSTDEPPTMLVGARKRAFLQRTEALAQLAALPLPLPQGNGPWPMQRSARAAYHPRSKALVERAGIARGETIPAIESLVWASRLSVSDWVQPSSCDRWAPVKRHKH
jgi:hypothetical protein